MVPSNSVLTLFPSEVPLMVPKIWHGTGWALGANTTPEAPSEFLARLQDAGSSSCLAPRDPSPYGLGGVTNCVSPYSICHLCVCVRVCVCVCAWVWSGLWNQISVVSSDSHLGLALVTLRTLPLLGTYLSQKRQVWSRLEFRYSTGTIKVGGLDP